MRTHNNSMRNLIGTLLRRVTVYFPRMWVVTGSERCTGVKMSVIWCGAVEQQAYMLNRIFGAGSMDRRYLGRRPLLMLKRLQRRNACPLGVIAGPSNLLTRVRQDDDIEVPWWIGSEIDIDEAFDPKSWPKSLKSDLRRLHRNNLRFRCTTDAESYKDFYDNFYLPSVIDSHGESTITASFESRLQRFRDGEAELVWVIRGADPVCGMVVCYDEGIPVLRDIGVRDGDKSIRSTGAITAAYYFSLQHIRERGFDRARLGLSRPFLNDGVLTFKQKWRPRLIEPSRESFLIRASRLCDASRSFLRTCSFIGEEEGRLNFTLIAANDDDFKAGRPLLDRLSSIYGIDSRSYVDVSGRRPRIRKAS